MQFICIIYILNFNKELINKRTKLGHTPLWIASYKGHVDIVRFLVEQAGANMTIPSSKGGTPFSISCQQGNLNIVEYLRSKGDNVTNSSSSGAKCLFLACFNGHLAIVQYILKIFPNLINTRNEFGQSPLSLASHNGSFEVVEYLIKNGADVHNVGGSNKTKNNLNENLGNNNIAAGELPLIPSCTGTVLTFSNYLTCKWFCTLFGRLIDTLFI